MKRRTFIQAVATAAGGVFLVGGGCTMQTLEEHSRGSLNDKPVIEILRGYGVVDFRSIPPQPDQLPRMFVTRFDGRGDLDNKQFLHFYVDGKPITQSVEDEIVPAGSQVSYQVVSS